MSVAIPVQNLYYLLSYAWDSRLPKSTLENITDSHCPDLAHFFTRILTARLQPLIRRGLDRSYLVYEELTPQPKGRIDFTASAKRQTWHQGKLHCSYDDLSRNVLHNKIIKTTLLLLYRKTKLEKELQLTLHQQLEWFQEVDTIHVSPRSFRRIQWHRNNREYEFILHICELIHASLLPEHHKTGKRKFRRIEENEKLMAGLFERFILAFAKKHFPDAGTGRPHIVWDAQFHSKGAEQFLPRMETDVTMTWTDRKLIIDCKYYKDAFTSRSYGDSSPIKRFRTGNLYQIFSYLINQRRHEGWEHVEGMLLYPTTTEDFCHDFSLSGHRVQVASINLNQNWQQLEEDLKKLLANELQAKHLPEP